MSSEDTLTVRKPRFSLRLKLTVGLILIIGIIFSATNLYNLYKYRSGLFAESETNQDNLGWVVGFAVAVQLQEHNLHSSSIKTFLNNFLYGSIVLNKKNKDIAFGFIVDTKNRLISGRAKPKMVRFPHGQRLESEPEVLQKLVELGGKLGSPYKVKRFRLMAGSRHVGWFYVGASRARIKRETNRALTINAGIFIGALLLLFGYSAVALSRMVTKPLGRVMNAMHAVQEGRFDQHLELNRNDEMGVLADTYNIMVRGLAEREKLKDAFSRYVSTQVYERLKRGEINLEGETRNATVLFSDIRSFTALSERMQPHEVVTLLNAYFDVMVEIVFKYEGFLNKFIGDALMAVYNVPIDQTEPELRAVRTALEMQSALEKLNRERAERGHFAIKIGVGINTGPVTAGNIGHPRRLEYTVIGDTVNLAQRVESQTKVSGKPVLISESTYEAVASHVLAEPLPPVKVKGKQEPVALYAVRGLRTDADAPIPVPPPTSHHR